MHEDVRKACHLHHHCCRCNLVVKWQKNVNGYGGGCFLMFQIFIVDWCPLYYVLISGRFEEAVSCFGLFQSILTFLVICTVSVILGENGFISFSIIGDQFLH